VAIGSTTEFTNHPFAKTYFNANSGLQSLDLTGSMDNGVKMGVQQSVATQSGAQYQLSFYVGSFGPDITHRSVELDINGTAVGTFTNSLAATYPPYNGDGVAGNTWQQFTYDFAATGSSTTIAFYNLASAGVSLNGLDDVSLTATAVPDPRP